MLSPAIPPQRHTRRASFVYQLVLALVLCAATARAATYYHVTFEEPTHHAGQLPTLGGAPDKVSSMTGTSPDYGRDRVYDAISIVATPTGQKLKLLTAYPSLHLVSQSALFDAPAAANGNLTLSFDVGNGVDLFSIGLPGVGRSVVFDRYLSSIHLRGNAGYSKDIPSSGLGGHVTIEVLPQAGLWIGTINGTEIWREPYDGTQPCGLSFATSTPFQGNSTEQDAFVDNVVIADFAPNQAPTFTKGANVAVGEDATPYSQVWATGISAGSGEEWQRVTFEVIADHPEFFSVAPAISPAGILTFTPAPNAFGQATLAVRLLDNGTTTSGGINASAPQTFTIDLMAVNDSPTLNPLANQLLVKNAGEQSVGLSGITTGAANESGTLKITATSSAPAVIPNPEVVYASPDATGSLKFTPVAGATGLATIQVKVEEVENPAVQVTHSFTVQVFDHYPFFIGGPNVQVQEDSTLPGFTWATSITTDPAGPQGPVSFEVTTNNDTLFSTTPALSASGNLIFAVAPNAYGLATVTARLRVGNQVSDPETFTITVTPVNDAPSFTAGPSLAIDPQAGAQSFPQWATQISGGASEPAQAVNFTVSNNYSQGFSVQPAISADGHLTFTPASGADGYATLTIVLNDNAGGSSPSATRTIQLVPYNQVSSYNITFEEPVHHLGALPTEGASSDKVSKVYAPNNGSQFARVEVATAPTGLTGQALKLHTQPVGAGGGPFSTITLDPAAGLTGDYTISYDVIPQFGTGGALECELNGDYGYRFVMGPDSKFMVRNSDVSKEVGTFSNDAVYHVTLEVLPSQSIWVGRVNGTEIFREPFALHQPPAITFYFHIGPGGASSDVYLDNIAVAAIAVNKAPSFTKGANLIVAEDAPAYSQSWATNISAGANEAEQTVSFEVVNDQPALFSVAPAISPAGLLTFTPAPNAIGHANLTVRLSDNGGTGNGGVNVSASQAFTIDVTAVNDPPTLNPLANLLLVKNAGEQIVNLAGITTGAANETATLKITATSSEPAVIPNPQVTYTSSNASGALKFTPASGATGVVTISVKVEEVENAGVQTTRSFTVKVSDHLPSFLSGPNVQAQEDTAFDAPGWATIITTDPNGPQGPISFEVSTNHDALFSARPAISPAGDLTFTGATDAFGQATATVRLHVGDQVSDPQTFTITVAQVNDPPSFTAGSSLTVTQRSGTTVVSNWATQIKSGPGGESEAVSFVVSVDHPEYFSLQPGISAAGALNFAPKGDVTGTAAITVYLQDAGGLKSASVSRSIEVTASSLTPGSYRALVQAPAGQTTVNTKAGWVTIMLTPSGRFTGRIVLHHGEVRQLTGKVAATGALLFGHSAADHTAIAVKGLPALDLQLSLSDSADGPKLSGVVSSNNAPFAEISGGLAAFVASANPVAPFRGVPDALLGRYTVVLTPHAPSQSNPTGTGYATLNVSRNGTASLVGRTPDDKSITWSGPILDDLSLPLYIPIIAGRGSLSGFAYFRNVADVSDLDGQDLHWSSPAARPRPAFDGVRVVLAGSKYSGAGFVGLQPATHTDYLAHFTLPLVADQTVTITHGVTASTSAGSPFIVRINSETGLISGSYKRQTDRKPLPFRGVILSKQSTAYGYFAAPAHGEALVIAPQ